MPPITIRPADGGQLVTSLAEGEVGLANYRTKRNFRRHRDAEVLREGFAPFVPFPGQGDEALQSRPTTSPITLISEVVWDNGGSTIVAGSKTELFALQGPGRYVADGYVAAGYVEANSWWKRIGSGFSANGRRWQAEMVGGSLWLNNAVDLPVIFSAGSLAVVPSYELRDQGILSVDVICSVDDVPTCFGIREASAGDDALDAILPVVSSGDVKVSQAGAKLSGVVTATLNSLGVTTASGSIFSPTDVGREIRFFAGEWGTIVAYTSPTSVTIAGSFSAIASASGFVVSDPFNPAAVLGDSWSLLATGPFFTSDMVGKEIAFGEAVRTVTAFISNTHVKVDSDMPAPAATAYLDSSFGYLRQDLLPSIPESDYRADRALWGNVGNSSDFGASLPIAATAGSQVVTTSRVSSAFSIGDEVVVEGGGASGGNLIVDQVGDPVAVVDKGPGFLRLSVALQTGGTLRLMHASALGSIAGYEDLEDGGGSVIAAKKVNGATLIHKDRSMFFAAYTGSTARPIVFQPITVPHDRALHFRNCSVAVDDELVVFPGRSSFWSFDPVSRKVRPMASANLIENLFFDFATVDQSDSIFAADNVVSQEIWWFNAKNSADPVLCYDYRWNTFSTADFSGIKPNGQPTPQVNVTAAASVHSPSNASGETESWFLMGTADGRIITYGGVTAKKSGSPDWAGRSIYYRQSTNDTADRGTYECVLSGGLSNFGDELNAKLASSYLIQFGSVPSGSPSVTVEIWGANSGGSGKTMRGSKTIQAAADHGLVPLLFKDHSFQDVIRTRPPAGDPVTPLRLASRVWTIAGRNTKSHDRR